MAFGECFDAREIVEGMIGAMAARTVWIVSHFEFLGPPYWLDEIVSHVATTKSAACRFVQEVHVDPGTWWGIQPFGLDRRQGEQGRQVLYSRTGRVMKRGYSLKRALKLGRKVRARNAALFRKVQREKKKGGTKHAPSRPS